jgi:hypothetical protein
MSQSQPQQPINTPKTTAGARAEQEGGLSTVERLVVAVAGLLVLGGLMAVVIVFFRPAPQRKQQASLPIAARSEGKRLDLNLFDPTEEPPKTIAEPPPIVPVPPKPPAASDKDKSSPGSAATTSKPAGDKANSDKPQEARPLKNPDDAKPVPAGGTTTADQQPKAVDAPSVSPLAGRRDLPPESELEAAEAVSAADKIEVIGKYQAIPAPDDQNTQLGSKTITLAALSAPADKCRFFIHGLATARTMCFDSSRRLGIWRWKKGKQNELFVGVENSTAPGKRSALGAFWTEAAAVKFAWSDELADVAHHDDLPVLKGLAACVLEALAESKREYVALYSQVKHKRLSFRVATTTSATSLLDLEDLGATLPEFLLRLGAGKMYLDTGDVFDFPDAGDAPVAVERLDKEMEVEHVHLKLLHPKDRKWQVVLDVVPKDTLAAKRAELAEKEKTVNKFLHAYGIMRQPRSSPEDRHEAAKIVAQSLHLPEPPAFPDVDPPAPVPGGRHANKKEKAEYEKQWREAQKEANEKWGAYRKALENDIIKPAEKAVKEAADLKKEIEAEQLKYNIKLRNQLSYVKEIYAVLYHLVDDKLRSDDVVLGEP